MEEIKTIKIEDSNFPKALKDIPDPPKVLYYRGIINPEELCFAVVGTRRYSTYGKQAAQTIVGELVNYDIAIVSGLAPGIDTFAHTAAVDNKKRTIAILGTGIDEKSIYPKENISLSRKILELGGALISEYPPKTPGSKFSFPRRNRIISGMSQGVLVVEAKMGSGSLITASYAISQRKKLFAVPGSIYSINSKGTNWLIKNGAIPADSASDILKNLGIKTEARETKNIAGNFSQDENIVLEILKDAPLHIDKVIEKAKLNASEVIGIVAVLEMKGIIINIGENNYALSA